VFLPASEEALAPLRFAETELEGTVVNFSDSGSKPYYFAVVDVMRKQSVVVPVKKLQAVVSPDREDNK